MSILLLFAFLAGIVTILSPCILPMLPIILSGTVGKGKSRPLGIISGFIFSFSLFTLALSALVSALGINANFMRILAAVFILMFGLVMVVPWIKNRFLALVSGLTTRFSAKNPQDRQKSGYWSGVILGFSLGLVWTPCVGSIMASVHNRAAA